MVFKPIRLIRERTRLEELAKERGFDSTASMLHDMYDAQQMSLTEICENLVTPMWSLRKAFAAAGIEARTKGGRNNVKFEITPELIDEVSRDGVSYVSMRLGVDYLTLANRLRTWAEEQEKIKNEPQD